MFGLVTSEALWAVGTTPNTTQTQISNTGNSGNKSVQYSMRKDRLHGNHI